MKYTFRKRYPKIENKLYNEAVFRSASQAIDLCASIEDVMAELIQASHGNDLCPVYIDGEAKKEVMLAIRELNHICNNIISNDEAPVPMYTDTDIEFKRFINSLYGSVVQNDED